MGKIVPPRDAPAITQAILDILDAPECFQGDSTVIHMRYAPATVASAYENLFEELVAAK
jgi:hypothetical protein